MRRRAADRAHRHRGQPALHLEPPQPSARAHLAAVADPRGNLTRYGLDDFGRRVFTRSPDTGVTRYAYDGAERLRAKTDAGGRTARFEHGPSGRLRALTLEGLYDFQYRYDRAGRIVGIDDHGAIAERFRYDAAGRLDFALTPAALFGYAYDANGNRTEALINGQPTRADYAGDSNRLRTLADGVAAPDLFRK